MPKVRRIGRLSAGRSLPTACAVFALLIGAATSVSARTSKGLKPHAKLLYKHTAQRDLYLYVFRPEAKKFSGARPAIVFFFGGGWAHGSPTQFYRQSDHLAAQGMVAICADYRIRGRDKTSPFDSVKDAFSAMRWVRAHAKALNIDPNRIVASGGSAGGHLAAAVATLTADWTKQGKNLAVSPRPEALVLFNPVYDNGPGGYGYSQVKARWKSFSPMNNIAKGMCPTLVMFGTNDRYVPTKTALAFQTRMKAVGSRSELVLFGGAGHGFFNGSGYYRQTVALMDTFLRSLGYLPPAAVPWSSADGK